MSENGLIRVLIADDDAGMRLVLRKKIAATAGFQVVGEAANGQEAMEIYDRTHPQVIFLDVDMPGKTGVECARLIQDQNPAAVLIFATGHEEYRGEAFEVYAFDYLVKPFKLARLEQTLARIQTRLRREPAEALPPPPASGAPEYTRAVNAAPSGRGYVSGSDGYSAGAARGSRHGDLYQKRWTICAAGKPQRNRGTAGSGAVFPLPQKLYHQSSPHPQYHALRPLDLRGAA